MKSKRIACRAGRQGRACAGRKGALQVTEGLFDILVVTTNGGKAVGNGAQEGSRSGDENLVVVFVEQFDDQGALRRRTRRWFPMGVEVCQSNNTTNPDNDRSSGSQNRGRGNRRRGTREEALQRLSRFARGVPFPGSFPTNRPCLHRPWLLRGNRHTSCDSGSHGSKLKNSNEQRKRSTRNDMPSSQSSTYFDRRRRRIEKETNGKL